MRLFQITDLHFGHPTVTAENMYHNYKKYIASQRGTISKCDILLFTGDLTDSLLYTNSPEYAYTLKFMLYLASICAEHDMYLICIKGTPSHEMDQMDNILITLTNSYPSLKVRYHVDLAYHTIPELDITYITIPDQICKDDTTLFTSVRSILREQQITKVDFMFTHTEFEEAITYATDKTKSAKVWSNMVNHYILNGHIHQHSVRSKVITCGALDFLSHGDTEAKGGLLIALTDTARYRFLPNPFTTTFLTLDLECVNLDSLQRHITELNNTGKPYNIRVQGNLDAITASTLRQENHLLKLTVLKPKRTHTTPKAKFKTFAITRTNVVSLITDTLNTKDPLLVKELDLLIRSLK